MPSKIANAYNRLSKGKRHINVNMVGKPVAPEPEYFNGPPATVWQEPGFTVWRPESRREPPAMAPEPEPVYGPNTYKNSITKNIKKLKDNRNMSLALPLNLGWRPQYNKNTTAKINYRINKLKNAINKPYNWIVEPLNNGILNARSRHPPTQASRKTRKTRKSRR